MRFAALMHPRADRRLLARFRGAEIADTLPPGCEAALVFGGDGTMHRHLRALVDARVPALSVPTGSGNDFAHALGLHSVADAERAWSKFLQDGSNVRNLDVAEIVSGNSKPETRNFFCCIAGVGLDSEVNRRANSMSGWLRRHGGYVLALLPALFAFRAPHVSAEVLDAVSGETIMRISEPAMLCAFANAPAYGDGMRMAPRAKLDDGLLDICFVRRTGKLRLLRLFPAVFSGGHLELPEIRYLHAARLRVESTPPMDLYADGEFVARTPAEITVKPKALRMIFG